MVDRIRTKFESFQTVFRIKRGRPSSVGRNPRTLLRIEFGIINGAGTAIRAYGLIVGITTDKYPYDNNRSVKKLSI